MIRFKKYTEVGIAGRIWFCTSLCLVAGGTLYSVFISSGIDSVFKLIFLIPVFIGSLVFSLPALFILWRCLLSICKRFAFPERKWALLILSNLFITFLYGLIASTIDVAFSDSYDATIQSFQFGGTVAGVLF